VTHQARDRQWIERVALEQVIRWKVPQPTINKRLAAFQERIGEVHSASDASRILDEIAEAIPS
jgi:hypothetical protein